jgi:putative DNA primase/helicase
MNKKPSIIHENSKAEFAYSTVTNRFDKNPKYSIKLWEEFCESFSNPDRSRGNLTFEEYHSLYPTDKQQRGEEKDGLGWLSAVFNPSEGRSNENVERVTGLVLDIDTGGVKREVIETILKGLEFFAHTTYSHTHENPKWRVIIPFKEAISPLQLESVFNHFNHLFGGILDTCGKRPSQLYYISSCPFDGPFESFRHSGILFDSLAVNTNPPEPTNRKTHSDSHGIKIRRSSKSLPKPCKDGERHGIFLSTVGQWLKSDHSYEEILILGREWNSSNIDPWPDEVLVSKVDGIYKSDQRNNPERYEPKPWDGIEIPIGFELSLNGVSTLPHDDKKPGIYISSQCWVSAETRNIQGSSWGVLVEWIDRDNKPHKLAIPNERFHETGNILAQDLASQGLKIVPGNEKLLLKYLGLFESQSRLLSVSQLGWIDKPGGKLTYVLPNQVMSNDKDEICVFQAEKHSPSATTIKVKGTLEDWQNKIAYLAQDHPYLIFCLCVSFAGPLLKAAGLEGGGFHLYGRSSHGKTTAAQLAASVWGCGADPSEAPKQSYVRKWNTTHNALEALAASHNDGTLILDEAGTCNAKDFGKVIYDITGGQGKVSLMASRSIRESRSWHILILSTGEISAQQKIEEEGKTARAGQMLRLMDIPIQDGIFDIDDRKTASQLAQEIKGGCSDYYGSAGPAFLENLIKKHRNFHSLRKLVKDEYKKGNSELTIKSLEPEKARALQRLALVMVAGNLAVELGILPFEKEEINSAILHIRNVWLKGQDSLSHTIRGIIAIREFIVRHQSRFEDASHDNSSQKRDLVGYFDKTENLFLFTTDGFKEACNGLNFKEVLEDLRKKGLLLISEANRFTYKKQVPGIGRFRFYAVEGKILEYENDLSGQNSGAVGQ